MGIKFLRSRFFRRPVRCNRIDRCRAARRGLFQRKAPKALPESLLLFSVDHRVGVVVTLHGPNPVIHTVLEVADATVRITHRPTGDQFLLHISDIVPIDIFHVDGFGPVLDQNAAAVGDNRCWDTHLGCEDSELVRFSIPIGVLANADTIATFARDLQFVGIIHGFANPKPSAFVPVHRDRLTT